MKVRTVKISVEFLGDLCKTHETKGRIKIEGIPTDAEFVGANYDIHKRQLILSFFHSSFANIPRGERLPIQDIMITEINCEQN